MFDFALQFLATVLLLAGIWMMGDKRLKGPVVACISEILFVVIGIQHHVWSTIVIGAVLFVIQARNFRKWLGEGASW